MIAGRDAPTFGEAKNSWLTGTAAWSFVGISQAILGIRPTLDGLQIDPCIPAEVKGYTIIRRYRGATYEITVENPDGVQHGVRALFADGKLLSGNTLPVAPAGCTVRVRAVMG